MINDNDLSFSNVSIFGIVKSQNVRLLVDTGAGTTIISEQFYNDILFPDVLLTSNNVIPNIKTADGYTTPVIGLVTFVVTIGDQTYNCNASVLPNLAYCVVLGRDFLHKNGAVINVPNEKVTFAPNNTITYARNSHDSLSADVRASNTYVIEGHCEAIIPAYLAKPVGSVVG